MKATSILIFTALLLSACGSAESDAKRAVLERLKDPDSAKFGKFTQVTDKGACLTVNARNSMGGYPGAKEAMLYKQDDRWSVLTFEKVSHEACIEIMKDVSKK